MSQVVFCSRKGRVAFKAEKSKLAPFFSRDASSISALEKRELDTAAILGSTGPDRFILTENDPVMRRWGKEGIVDFWKGKYSMGCAKMNADSVLNPVMRQRHPAYIWHSY